jgi:hypothetical protein
MGRNRLGYVSSTNTGTILSALSYGTATGGSSSSITVSGQNYTLLTFTSDTDLAYRWRWLRWLVPKQ